MPAQHDDLVGQEHRFFDIVRDEQHGGAGRLPDADQFLLQVAAGNGVDRAEGFVHQQKVRLDGQGAGNAYPLRLPTGQLVGPAAAVVPHACQLQRGIDALRLFHAIQPQAFQAVADVAADRAPGHQAAVLEHDGARAASRARLRWETDRTGRGFRQARGGAQQGTAPG
ncbi:hypothetical protein G6F62_013814 [Rhizopus arrhizus]|nr:hypothetical protein G6F62_013814 [Rhizopus arrhizus]